jgi:hypothetical protein
VPVIVALVIVGASAGVAVVVEVVPLPATFLGVIVKVYWVPLESPVKVHVKLVVFVQPGGGDTAGLEVIEYPVIGLPPLLEGGLHVSTDSPFTWLVAAKDATGPGVVGAIVTGLFTVPAFGSTVLYSVYPVTVLEEVDGLVTPSTVQFVIPGQ